jgi:hypothetical protein
MSIKTELYAAISAVFGNVHAVELPEDPTYPIAVFEVTSDPEEGWCVGGGYDRHDIKVVILSADMDAIDTIKALISEAVAAIDGYLWDGDQGDADFEGDPSLYAYYLTFEARTRR